jgi:hypothetical protein
MQEKDIIDGRDEVMDAGRGYWLEGGQEMNEMAFSAFTPHRLYKLDSLYKGAKAGQPRHHKSRREGQ